MLDNVMGRVKSDMEYKAGIEISSGISKGVGNILNKEKAMAGKCPKCNTDYPVGTKFCA